jgi:hypothetical protein
MKIILAAGAFAVALAMPLGAYAQQGAPPAAPAYGRTTTPSEAHLQRRWARRFGNLNLSNDQQQRIQSLIHQYSQTHPEGSPRDPGANRDLRRQIMGQLNSDQQNQFRQQMRARRAQLRQGQQGEYQPGYGDQRYQQGPQDQQYQQGPPPGQQYQQGPPPDQQYQQGPPPGQQYQQGPPPDQQYQQGPPGQQPGPPPT